MPLICWEKAPRKLQSSLKQELKEPRAQVVAIGLAGENRVYFASIEHGRSSAARQGLGAVMGSKRLKAIAVRGNQGHEYRRPDEYFKLCNDVLKNTIYRMDILPQE